jgi:glutathione synthase
MHVLFIIDPIESLKAYKDSSVAIMFALAERGHSVSVCYPGDLFTEQGQVLCRGQAISLHAHADLHSQHWFDLVGVPIDLPLSAYAAVVMRKDPPFDMEYVYTTHLLDVAEQQGARVFNRGVAIRNHPEKLAITEFSEFTTPTLVTSDMARLKAFHEKHGDVIVKPLDGMGGTGIFRMMPGEPNRGAILEMLTQYGKQTIMAQRYIPEIVQGDKRVLIINGEPVPYALARIPLAGETRGNLAAGGRGVAQPLTERDLYTARTIGSILAPRGLFLIGLDIIGEFVTEINVTSPTCFVEITEQTEFNVANFFVQSLEKTLSA